MESTRSEILIEVPSIQHRVKRFDNVLRSLYQLKIVFFVLATRLFRDFVPEISSWPLWLNHSHPKFAIFNVTAYRKIHTGLLPNFGNKNIKSVPVSNVKLRRNTTLGHISTASLSMILASDDNGCFWTGLQVQTRPFHTLSWICWNASLVFSLLH